MLPRRSLLILFVAIVLSGCAVGTNFARPQSDALTLGQTTYEQVLQQFGTSYKEGSTLINEVTLKTLTYSYASAGGASLVGGVTPGRSIGFFFRDNVLVGYQFVSSFREDHTDFDESRVKDIRKGETTEAQVLAMLGPPAGFVRYPIVKEETHRGLVYIYSQVKGSAFNLKFHAKRLVVALDPTGTVADVQFESTGLR